MASQPLVSSMADRSSPSQHLRPIQTFKSMATPVARSPSQSQPSWSRRLYRDWVEKWWLAELLAVVLSCTLVVALALILHHFDGAAAPCIGPDPHVCMSLNTLVVLLVTISVAAALSAVQECLGQLKWLWYHRNSRQLSDLDTYDRASRSTFGAFRLLLQSRFASSPLAYLCSVLVVAHLAIAPLAQQAIVQFSSRVPIVPSYETTPNHEIMATAPVSAKYHAEVSDIRTSDVSRYYGLTGSRMKGAILSGLFSSEAINHSVPFCVSGNCTFPTYSTLSICASLEDVSAQVEHTENTQDSEQWCLPGNICLNEFGKDLNQTKADYILNVTAALSPDNNTNLFEKALVSPNENWRVGMPANFSSLAFANHTNPLVDVYMIHNYQQNQTVAYEFILDWCVRDLKTEVINGTASTVVVDEDWLSLPMLNITGLAAYPAPWYNATLKGRNYSISPDGHFSLQRYLGALFNGTVSYDADTPVADNERIQMLAERLGIQGPGVDTGRWDQLTGKPALNALLQNMTISMSNAVRVPSSLVGSSDFQHGDAFVQQSTISVSWGWIAAPCVFSAASAVFVILVVLMAARPGVASEREKHVSNKGHYNSSHPLVWKSSIMATLGALDADLKRSYGGMGPNDLMKRVSNSQSVRLIYDEDTGDWHLVPEGRTGGNIAKLTGPILKRHVRGHPSSGEWSDSSDEELGRAM